MAFFDTWLKLNRKQILVHEREAPLRNELFLRILFFTIGTLALQFGLLWWTEIKDWRYSLFPGTLLLAAILTRKRIPPFAFVALFMALVLTVTLPASKGLVDYPQYGAATVLTILVAGLLFGRSSVWGWTVFACITRTGAMETHSWTTYAGWCTVYASSAWIVTLYSRHLQRLFEVGRAAEEQQRNAIVAERTRFARDIHDTLAQGFTGIMMQLNAAEQRLQGEPSDARVHIEKARQLASESLEEARRSVSALRAGALSDGSLLEAMEQIGRKLTSDSGVQLETKLEGQPYALPEQYEANLLRIAQEAMTNAVRHSGTKRIGIRLAYRTGSVVLEVDDSGRGMSGVEPSGFGVDGMRERARQIGGEIQILSDPGCGTRIVVTVPNA
ncbi:MAG: sensor histidine kinase [Acidobacteriia bacterium]|nr:sensor histidine kinase [Terriglobia bacterium]